MARQTSGWLDALAAERSVIERSSTAARVADALRTRITEGALQPGTRLSEEEIGQALGVSRNTLREAFRLLSHERLLVHEFNRGVFVRSLAADDVRDLYRFRRILESAAVRQAARTTPDLTGLRTAVEAGERAAAAEDWAGVGTANMHFHRAVGALATSPRVDEAMQQVLAEMRLVFAVMADPNAFHGPYLAENRALHDLMARGRYDDAEQALQDYFDVAEAQLLDALSRRVR